MIYDIRQTTSYAYESAVSRAHAFPSRRLRHVDRRSPLHGNAGLELHGQRLMRLFDLDHGGAIVEEIGRLPPAGRNRIDVEARARNALAVPRHRDEM